MTKFSICSVPINKPNFDKNVEISLQKQVGKKKDRDGVGP